MNLVIVESPAKAKTINKYLGKDYLVLASYGHIRDLPSKNGSVNTEKKFEMEWEIDSFSKKYLKEITDAAKDSSKIILATDPDREGEAIAWHVKEVLDSKKLLKNKQLERVVFNEITKNAVLNAIKNPYNVVIGVAGANGLKSGGYTLVIQIEGGEKNMAEQEEVKLYNIACEKGKVLSYEGNLNKGVQIHDLSWAWNSSVACFPETQKKKFTGNHVIYVTEIPRYSKMEVTIEPKDVNANLSLYVYEIGTNSNAIVPNLPSCVSCEVDHKWDRPHKGKTQDHTRSVSNITAINNPYKVVIGVVGADGLKEGDYTLKVKLESR